MEAIPMKVVPIHLACEYTEHPLWIDNPRPRFSWKLPGETRDGFSQSAYQIEVFNQSDMVVWDSGMVRSEEPFGIHYQGIPLHAFSVYRWHVRICDEQGIPGPFSLMAIFETSALSPEDFQAKWISDPAPVAYFTSGWESGNPNQKIRPEDSRHYMGIYLSQRFSLAHPWKNICRARAYVTGVGVYMLYLNGIAVGNGLLSPSQTDYHKRVLYDVLPLDQYLRGQSDGSETEDHLACTLFLGNGRHIRLYGFDKPRGIVQLLFEYSSGDIQWCCSDGSWLVERGPILQNSIFDGESYDARIPFPRHRGTPRDTASFPSAVHAVEVEGYPLHAAAISPITRDKRVEPVGMWRVPQGYLYDFGQNFSGFTELVVQQPTGTMLSISYAENITEEGHLNPASNRSARACDTYICKGGGLERWHPIATYHGFRYALLTGHRGMPSLDTLQGIFIHTQTSAIGSFHCSHEGFNAVHQAILWGQLSNMMGIPTDSPQRDERHGWLGDAHLSAVECLLNFNTVRFYEKFIQDIADTQGVDGSITDVAPHFWMSKPADPAWGSAFISLGWYLYWYQGDQHILEQHFNAYERYLRFLLSHEQGGLVLDLGTFGDWCAPGLVTSKKTGLVFISTWYLHHDLELFSRMAEILGKKTLAVRYRKHAERIGNALREHFGKNGHFESLPMTPWDFPDQTSQVLALAGNLVPPEDQEDLATYLNHLVSVDSGDHIGTGIHGTRYILEVLSHYGYQEKAYTIASQQSYPGWMYMIREGATTLWERWEPIICEGMNSHNHIMFGSIDAWFYQYVAGISPLEAHWKRIALFPGRFSHMDHAGATVETPYGLAHLDWQREDAALLISIIIPPGSEGVLFLPAGFSPENREPFIPVENFRMAENSRLAFKNGNSLCSVLPSGSHCIRVFRPVSEDVPHA